MLKRYKSRIKTDNRGSAIVIVIMALAFIAILGITIMWMSMTNYRMKSTDQLNKQGFYTAETVMEQIRIGLQNDVSEAANTAYSIVMQNYSSWTDEDKREVEFQKEFKKSLVRIIADPSISGHYSIEHLKSFIDPSLNISVDVANKGTPVKYLSGTGEITNVSDDACIVIKDVSLEYTDDEGFYSEIKTDFMIEAPTTAFMDTSSLPPVFKYALVANEGLTVTEAPLEVEGSLYAGSEGIDTDQDLKITKGDYLVSKGPVRVEFGSETMSVSCNSFYAGDIKVVNSNLKVAADTRVANDLILNGDTPKVEFKGKYTGFGNSSSQSAGSSAIIVNGLGADLNMKGLNEMMIAGRSFIGTKLAETYDDTTTANGWTSVNHDSNADVMMGDSISVKGNQLAYLVPEECIGVNRTTKKVEVGKNPMSYGDYAEMFANHYNRLVPNAWDPDFSPVATDVQIKSLGGAKLSDYTSGADISDMIQTVFAPSNGDTLIYLYIKFPNSEKANDYARDYYSKYEEKLQRYTKVYANSIELPTDRTSVRTDSGVMVRYIDSEGNDKVDRELRNPLTDAQKTTCENYGNTYTALCTNLTEKYEKLSDDEKLRTVSENLVFESLIDESKFATYTGPITTGNENAIITNANNTFNVHEYNNAGSKIPVSRTGFIYDNSVRDPKDRIIISLNDVYLKANFEGLIITKGKIYVGDNITVRGIWDDPAKKEEILNILQQTETTTGIRPIDYFKDGSAINAITAEGDSGYVDLDSSVNYQNWVKR